MADTYKVLGQAMTSTSWATLYVVPSAKQASVSSTNAINTGFTGTYSIAVVPSAEYSATPQSKHIIVKSKAIGVGEHHSFTGGITLSAGDRIMISASSISVAVSAYGVEIS
jgi:hypothetical protein